MSSSRKCMLTRIYNRYTPHIQVVGFLWLVAGGFIAMQAIVQEAQAFGRRLTAVERAQVEYGRSAELLNQKVDLMIEFFRIPRKE